MQPLVDIGANLALKAFRDDLPDVLARAAAAGVEAAIVTGPSLEVSRQAQALVTARAARPRLYATAGVHPHHASEARGSWLDELRAMARRPGVVAVGECGLDFDRNYSPRED